MKKNIILYNNTYNQYQFQSRSIDTIITDPPYNIGYKYNTYQDKLLWEEYYNWQIKMLISFKPYLKLNANLLYLNYPETAAIIWSGIIKEYTPNKIIHWIYNTHTGGKPFRKGTRYWLWLSNGDSPYINEDFCKGEYKNPTDKRVYKLIEDGKKPTDYDWWHIEQVKNVSKEKTAHPCQLPLSMVSRLVGMTTIHNGVVCDPFMGSGTSAIAAIIHGCSFLGCELDKKYFDISYERISKYITDNNLIDEYNIIVK